MTEDSEIDEVDEIVRKAVIVLRRLASGAPVKLGEFGELLMCKNDRGGPVLGTECRKQPSGELVYLTVDMSLEAFLRECGKISSEDIYILGCENALEDMGRRRGRDHKPAGVPGKKEA